MRDALEQPADEVSFRIEDPYAAPRGDVLGGEVEHGRRLAGPRRPEEMHVVARVGDGEADRSRAVAPGREPEGSFSRLDTHWRGQSGRASNAELGRALRWQMPERAEFRHA